MRGYGCATSPVAAFVQRCNTTEAYCMLSAARRMRSARSTSAPLSCAFSCSLNSVGFLFPSIPSSLWYSHEFDLPKYVLERSAHEMASRMSFNCDFIVPTFSFVNVIVAIVPPFFIVTTLMVYIVLVIRAVRRAVLQAFFRLPISVQVLHWGNTFCNF